MIGTTFLGIVLTGIGIAVIKKQYERNKRKKAVAFIKNYKFPGKTVIEGFRKLHPNLTLDEEQQVIDSLKQFFIAKVYTKNKLLMPSKIADDLWHCHLEDFRSYVSFCKQAFGKPLSHFPVYADKGKKSLENLQKFPEKILHTYIACKHVQKLTDPSQTIPLLFVIDSILNIEDGFHYTPAIISRMEGQIQAQHMEDSGTTGDFSDFSSVGDSNSSDGDASSCSSCGD